MIPQPTKKLNYFEREGVQSSIDMVNQIKIGEFADWEYYDKLMLMKDCKDCIGKMLFGTPTTYIINRGGDNFIP